MKPKDKILKTLNDFGKLPSSKICAIAGVSYAAFKVLSKELLEEGKIKKIEETVATYWEITKKGLREVRE